MSRVFMLAGLTGASAQYSRRNMSLPKRITCETPSRLSLCPVVAKRRGGIPQPDDLAIERHANVGVTKAEVGCITSPCSRC
jgi:hypothetical protein